MHVGLSAKRSPGSAGLAAPRTASGAANTPGVHGSSAAGTAPQTDSGSSDRPASFESKLQALLQSGAGSHTRAQASRAATTTESAQADGETVQAEQEDAGELFHHSAAAVHPAGPARSQALAAESPSAPHRRSKAVTQADKRESRATHSQAKAATERGVGQHPAGATGSEIALSPLAVAASAPTAPPRGASFGDGGAARVSGADAPVELFPSDISLTAAQLKTGTAARVGRAQSMPCSAQPGEDSLAGMAMERVQLSDKGPQARKSTAVPVPALSGAAQMSAAAAQTRMPQVEPATPNGHSSSMERDAEPGIALHQNVPQDSEPPFAMRESVPAHGVAERPLSSAASTQEFKPGAPLSQPGPADPSAAPSGPAPASAPRTAGAEPAGKAGAKSSATQNPARQVSSAAHGAALPLGAVTGAVPMHA